MPSRSFQSRLLTVLFCSFAIVTLALAADPTGTISGLIVDPSGGTVVNATVTVKNSSTGLTRSITTDSQGTYLFPLMPVGSYELIVEMAGFRRFQQTGITVL